MLNNRNSVSGTASFPGGCGGTSCRGLSHLHLVWVTRFLCRVTSWRITVHSWDKLFGITSSAVLNNGIMHFVIVTRISSQVLSRIDCRNVEDLRMAFGSPAGVAVN